MRKRVLLLGFLSLLFAGLTGLLAGAEPARAGATLTVTTTQDVLDGNDGLCSLREAVIAANTDTASGPAVGECPAGSGADIISFAVGISGNLTIGPVNPSLPAITQSVSIQGPGADVLAIYRPANGYGLSFNGPGQVFSVTGISVTGLGAASGGVSANAGALTLDAVRLSGNAGQGGLLVSGGAVVTVTASQITGNNAPAGGGLYNLLSRVLVVGSVISGNNVGFSGGGIYNVGQLEIVDSLIAFNGVGGGAGDSQGGGIYSSGVLTMTNATLSGNLALDLNASGYGGGLFSSGQASLSNVTITGNAADGAGGGVRVGGGSMVIRNSVLADSSAGGDCSLGGGAIADGGFNLIEDNSCGFTGGSDPLLGELQDNGGPTRTHALSLGSPAIDAGNPAGCTDAVGAFLWVDQRGFARPFNGRCDIGAYEFGASAPPVLLNLFLPFIQR